MTPNDTAVLRLQLLGQVTGWRDQAELELGSAHRRTVLALLALSPGSVVSREELVDALWGDRPPASANGSIYTYVSSLRQALGGKRSGRSGHGLLESVGSGYSLRVPHNCVDVYRFDALRADAQRSSTSGSLTTALTSLDEALELWHGEALSGLTGGFAEAQRTRLGELRLATVEQRAEIGLVARRHTQVIADLSQLTQEHPLRETLRGLLMRALHESGRTNEALAVFADLREKLIQASGTEPSPALTKLHGQILQNGPNAALAADQPTIPMNMRVPAENHAPRYRPVRADRFAGREDMLGKLRTAVSSLSDGRGTAVLVHGEAGIGKSALLAEVFSTLPGARYLIAWGAADELGPHPSLPLVTDLLNCAGARFAEDAAAEIVPLVRQMCAKRPVVLIADDLHWADATTLKVWRHLIRLTDELPLLLVGACRPLPQREDLEQIKLDLAVRGDLVLQVGPLADKAVRRLVEHIAGSPPGRELTQLAAQAAGNPLYIKELIERLVAGGQIVVDGAEAYPAENVGRHVPPSVGVRIADHLTFLSCPTREALRWAALLGREFTLSDLAAAVNRPVAELADAVDEALTAGFLVETGEWLSFRHPIVGQVLYQKTPASMRVALHRQLAESLANGGAPASRVAEQLTAAKVPVDTWVSEWLTRNIGQIATDSPYVAVDLLRHAVAQGTMTPAVRETLTITLARLLFWLGQEPSTEARLVLARTADSQCAAEMRWILAYLQYRRGHRMEAAEEVRRTLADASVSDIWRTRHMRLRERLDRGETSMPVLSAPKLLDDGLFADDMSASLAVARRMAPARAIPGEIHLAGAVHCYWVGRWSEAAEEVRTVLRGCPETSSYMLRAPGAVLLVNGLAATISGHRGDVDNARGYLRAATEHSFPQSSTADFDPDAAGFLMAATALLAEQEGRPEHALDALTPILDPHYPSTMRHQWLPHLARLAMRTGDRERAIHAMHAVQVVEAGVSNGESQAVAAHCQGLVTENPDRILAAAAYYRTTDRVLQLARTLEDAAALLAKHGRLDEARSALRTALVTYTQMGAGWDVRRAEARMRPFGVRRATMVASRADQPALITQAACLPALARAAEN